MTTRHEVNFPPAGTYTFPHTHWSHCCSSYNRKTPTVTLPCQSQVFWGALVHINDTIYLQGRVSSCTEIMDAGARWWETLQESSEAPGARLFSTWALATWGLLVPKPRCASTPPVSLTHYLSSMQACPLPAPAMGLVKEDVVAKRAS